MSALASVALVRGFAWRQRAVLAAVLLFGFAGTSGAWSLYWRAKIAHAHDVVQKAGGYPHPLATAPQMGHDLLFPLWTGLGDFGAAKGYAWSDIAAHRYVQKVLREKHGQEFPAWSGGYTLDAEFLDAKKRYIRLPYSVPHYFDIIREKIVSDIRRDPAWFLGVLGKRAWSVSSEQPAAQIVIGKKAPFAVPSHGWLFPVVLALLALARNGFLIKLAIFSLPLSLPALLVYSKGGMIYVSTFHLFAVGITLATVFYGAAWWLGRIRGQAAPRRPRR
jgi:hypothetical protein